MQRLSRRQFMVGAAGLGVAAGCGRLPWQGQPPRVHRIGFLASQRLSNQEALFQRLQSLGYLEGQNIVIERRYAEGDEQLHALAAELVRLQPDVLVAGGSPAVSAAQQITKDIPIVMPVSSDPVEQGYVTSLSRPGGNITGLTTIASSAISGKRLQLLKDTATGLTRVAVLWNPTNSGKVLEFKQTNVAAGTLGVQLDDWEVRSRDDLAAAFAGLSRQHPDALLVLSDPLTVAYKAQIADFAMQNRLPCISESRGFAEAGLLMTYGPNLSDLYAYAATYVDKILKGAKPADLPVEQPMVYDFVVNMKTARALGITFPYEVALQITEVIE
jgi:putative ABC transport system substrate-binding protein